MCDYQFYQCITLQTVAMLDIKGNSAGTAIGIKFRVSYHHRGILFEPSRGDRCMLLNVGNSNIKYIAVFLSLISEQYKLK